MEFGCTSNISLTILVDNLVDMLLLSSEMVTRYRQSSGEPLLAEHGFSVLVEFHDLGINVLWDAGITSITLMENMRRLGHDPSQINQIALSHGHPDHIAAVADLLAVIAGPPGASRCDTNELLEKLAQINPWRKIPIVMHPAALRERWILRAEERYGPMQPTFELWQALGAEFVMSTSPYCITQGCWVTGEIPRITFEKAGVPPHLFYRENNQFVKDNVEDDQALIINVDGKGLVVLAGCAHAGILNTLRYAQEISGVERIYAILGGFHLAPYSNEQVDMTVEKIEKLSPVIVAPSHCTGFQGVMKFAQRMPDNFVLSTVGTKYRF